MIALDGVPGGYARHNGLGASAVSRKIMKLNVAETDTDVCLCHIPIDINRGSPSGSPHMYKIILGVYTFYPVKDLFTYQMNHFLSGMGAMASESENDGNIAVRDSSAVQLLKNRRKNQVRGKGPCNIAGDDGYLLTRRHQIL